MRTSLILLLFIAASVFVPARSDERSQVSGVDLFRAAQPHEMPAQNSLLNRSEFVDGQMVVIESAAIQQMIGVGSVTSSTNTHAEVSGADTAPKSPAFVRIQLPNTDQTASNTLQTLALETRLVKPRGEGVTSWRGASRDGHASATLTIGTDGQCFGRLKISGETYVILPISDGTHFFARVDKNALNARLASGFDATTDDDEYMRELERARIAKSTLKLGR